MPGKAGGTVPPPINGETYRAGRPALGARLLAAGQLVNTARPVADIGCDHGKLAVWLALAGASRVVAVDNRPLPLGRAQALVSRCGLAGRVDCRLGDGLSALAPLEAEEIVIAGLSGETVLGLVAACAWIRTPKVHLVLVPTSRHALLRRGLCEAGFALAEERLVRERGRVYSVFSVRYGGVAHTPPPLFCQVGLAANSRDAAARAAYLRAVLGHLAKVGLAPMDTAARAAHNKLVNEVEECLL